MDAASFPALGLTAEKGPPLLPLGNAGLLGRDQPVVVKGSAPADPPAN